MKLVSTVVIPAVVVLAIAVGAGAAAGAERSLTLHDAIARAVEQSEGLVIERESLRAANAQVTGAQGAYDPVLSLGGSWGKTREPVNSAFSAAPAGEFAPYNNSGNVALTVRQQLPHGGALSLIGSGGRERTDGTFARYSLAYATRAGVELRQPLLRNRAIDPSRLATRVANAGREHATASLRRTVTETVAATEQVYWALTAARLEVSVREEAVKLADDQLAETRTRVESGTVPETELAQPRAELERRRGELLAAREGRSRAENSLKTLIVADSQDPLWQDEIAPAESVAIAVVPVDPEAALALALKGRPELDESQAVVAQRRAETSFARSSVWPALDAVAAYDRYGLAGSGTPAGLGVALPPGIEGGLGRSFQSLSDGGFDAVRVGLVLELPVTNRSARADAAVAQSSQRQAEAALEQTRKAIRAEVLDATAALETAGQRIEAARLGREAAEIQLAAEQDRYATGLSTNFLVLTRQNQLSRARLDEISALTDYRMARVEMSRATGTLIEDRNIDLRDVKP